MFPRLLREGYRRIEILPSVRIRHILLEESRCEDHTQAKSNRPEEEPRIVPRLATVAHATMGAQDQRESRMGLIVFGQDLKSFLPHTNVLLYT